MVPPYCRNIYFCQSDKGFPIAYVCKIKHFRQQEQVVKSAKISPYENVLLYGKLSLTDVRIEL